MTKRFVGSTARLDLMRIQAQSEQLRVTLHAHQEMANEDILLDEVTQALLSGEILEEYPEHKRGPCCLVGGRSRGGRPLHIVCSTDGPVLIITTVYEPKPPHWLTLVRRRSE